MDIINAKKECLQFDKQAKGDVMNWVREFYKDMIHVDTIRNKSHVEEKVK